VSAREELIEALTQGVAHSSEYAGLLIDNLLEEAVTKIREDTAQWDGWPEKQSAMGYAANLIDPYAK
jgi:hypothetical protein